jgi:hypothetical protein
MIALIIRLLFCQLNTSISLQQAYDGVGGFKEGEFF